MKDMLFLQLLLVSVTTGLIVLVIKAASNKLNKIYAAKWKYWLWLVLAVRLLIPWSPTLPVQPIEIEIEEMVQPENIVQDTNQMMQNVGGDLLPEHVEQTEGETAIVNPTTQVEDTEQSVDTIVQIDAIEFGESAVEENAAFSMRDILPIAEVLWVVGLVLFLTYHIICNIVYQRKVLRWSEMVDEVLRKRSQTIMGDVAGFDKLEVLVNKQVSGPMILGLIHTKLILPDKEYTDEELHFVLQHEFTHYRRKDLWYKALMLAVNAIHWFNPCVYLLCQEANADLERSCDSIVVQGVAESERRHYANMVLDTVAELGGSRHMLTSSFHGGKEELRKRLFNILDSEKKRKGIVLFGTIVVFVLVISGFVHLSTGKEDAEAEQVIINNPNESTKQPDETENQEEEENFNWYTHKSPMFTVSEAELGLDKAVYMEYEEAASKGQVVKYEGAHSLNNDAASIGEGGTLPGLGEGDWYCVTVDGIEYIYAKYDHREEYELFAYAVTGEDVVLENGLYVGMTREQVQQLCPGILDVKLDYEENIDIGWNGSAYPACWVNAYEYAMIINVDDGIEENPDVFLALMMQEDVVCAMTPYTPITDRTVVPLKPGEEKDVYTERGYNKVENLAVDTVQIYEKEPTPPDRYKTILLTNGEAEYTYESYLGLYDVCQVDENYILLVDVKAKGTGRSVEEPHLINLHTMEEHPNSLADAVSEESILESPYTFMERNFEQVALKEEIYMKFLGEEYRISAWKDSGTGTLYYNLTWEYGMDFYVEEGQLFCEMGLCQGDFLYRADVVLPYVYEDDRFVIDRTQAKFIINRRMNDLAYDSMEDANILQRENLDIDGDGVAEDKISLRRDLQGYEAHNVLTVELNGGLSATMKLPSRQVYFNDKGTCEIIPNLQMQGRNSIVVVLQDPHGNYGAAGYYVLHVEKNAENDAITLEMDCVIADSELMPEEYKYLEELQLELPFACPTYYGYPLRYYHEELGKNTLRINALTKGDMQETSACIYWEDGEWKIQTASL